MDTSPSRDATQTEAIFVRSEIAEIHLWQDEGFKLHKLPRRQTALEDHSIARQRRRLRKTSGFLAALCVLGVLYQSSLALCTQASLSYQVLPIVAKLSKYARQAARPFLVDFQVYPPVLVPTPVGYVLTNGSTNSIPTVVPAETFGCVVYQTIMVHEFARSYGAPFVGSYTSPMNCVFNRIILNLTVTSAGRQFDRLGIMYLGDTEIWRTSTAEPTQMGIIWTYIKDMSNYLALFRESQKLIFDLGNNIDATYTAPYYATLTATFFTAEDTVIPADLILPISARQSANNAASAFIIPQQVAINTLTLPRNVRRAVFTTSATGQIDEEFWYSNVLSSEVDTFPAAGTLLGYSPFREVQLLVDGMLAGVAWPFPIIFTGGVVPGFWRPIVGIDAFDLREDEIDITPWLPLLCDGSSHSFEIRVAGISDDGHGNGQLTKTVGNYWVVTGKIFLWLDPVGSITTGSTASMNVPVPSIQLSSSIGKDGNGTNQTLTYNVNVNRQLSISSHIKTASGSSRAIWRQDLHYSNYDDISNYGYVQLTIQDTNGVDLSSTGYARQFDYPIWLNSSFSVDTVSGNLSIEAMINRGQTIRILGQPVFPTGLQSFSNLRNTKDLYPRFQGSNLHTTQNGSASYFASPATSRSSSSGTTQQDMVFSGVRTDSGSGAMRKDHFPDVQGSVELYQRHVVAVNGTVVEDDESLIGQPIGRFHHPSLEIQDGFDREFAGRTVMQILGRGPGDNNRGF